MKTKKIRKVIPMFVATPEYMINYCGINHRATSLNVSRKQIIK